jgi:hypothetical protein
MEGLRLGFMEGLVDGLLEGLDDGLLEGLDDGCIVTLGGLPGGVGANVTLGGPVFPAAAGGVGANVTLGGLLEGLDDGWGSVFGGVEVNLLGANVLGADVTLEVCPGTKEEDAVGTTVWR